MILNLHCGKGFISAAIRWQTRSIYSHASLQFSDGIIYEARERSHGFSGGVRWLSGLMLSKGESVHQFEVAATPEQENAMRKWCYARIGEPYDYLSIVRFLTREPVDKWDRKEWFCSEFAFFAFRFVGIHLLANIHAWEVNPGMLRLSNLIRYLRTVRADFPAHG